MRDFVHLHVHTEYSLLDGAARVKDLIKYVKELGMKSIAITDHGSMYGVIDFYKEAVKNDIKPIIGCEVYVAKRSRFDKEHKIDSTYNHLVLLAKNNNGYKNLMKIVSAGYIDGFYYKPRIDEELLREYSDGIIGLSACLSGEIPKAIQSNDFALAKKLIEKYNNIFGEENFYLEIQSNGISEQNLVNKAIIKLSNETNTPVVATNDIHYLKKENARAHEILLCIQTGKNIDDKDRMIMPTNEFYVKSKEEMNLAFKEIPEAVENSVKIAEKCNVSLEFNKLLLPYFKIESNKDHFEYLRELCIEGLKVKYVEVNDKIYSRLDFELSVIKDMGYTDYFLIVWDFIKYAKDNKINVGPGRGSAAGSIVAYGLGITNIDPLKYNLLFERFLNPERISMPDIDIDFCYERRQEVIDYVIEKYGEDKVAQIITFGTMAARAAIRDVGRALNISYSEVDKIAKMIPFQVGMNIDKALSMNPELVSVFEENDKYRELISTAKLLEGMPRHASTHAAGVVISKEPITNYVPLQKNDECVTTQFSMSNLEELGLLKMDFLGLRTLTVLNYSINMVKENFDKDIDLEKLDFDDKNVYKMIGMGSTAGVFQLESSGMKQFMKELKPTSLEDIIAGISLYRPGPMEQIPRYISNKKNPENVTYHDPLLEKILNVTYGCMVYQEQVMQIVRDLAGYSLGRSDLVRRAMSKKKLDVMEQERKNFIYGKKNENGEIEIKGAVNNGVSETTANLIFNEMLDFASYAFNKSHAAAYAVIGYQTAWMKYYYPTEFFAALINSYLNSTDKIVFYIQECKNLKIEILPPDINESYVKFKVIKNKIRFGLAAIKNVGENAVNNLIEERKNGKFISFEDFCERLDGKDLNKRCLESLIKSGAFDSLSLKRSVLIASYEKIVDSIQQERKRNMEGQISFFDVMAEKGDDLKIKSFEYPEVDEYPKKVMLAMEKEIVGLYISGHPLSDYENDLKNAVDIFTSDLKDTDGIENLLSKDGKIVRIGGIINSKKSIITRNNTHMAFVEIEDMFGIIEAIIYSGELDRYSKFLIEGNIVVLKGRLSIKEDDEPKIICQSVELLNEKQASKLYLKLETYEIDRSTLSLFEYFSGNKPVYIYNSIDEKVKLLDNKYRVDINDTLLDELINRYGNDNVKVV